MGQTEIRVQLPDELAALLGNREQAATRAKQAIVLELVRAGRIGEGRASEVLGLTRHDLLHLLHGHGVAAGPQTLEEYRQDIDRAEQLVSRPEA